MKTSIRSLAIIALTITGFAFSPKAQAVVPPPDGGYPGFNTAEGDNALKNLNTATGQGNTAVGWFSLLSDVEGGFNTAVGAGALVLNTGSSNTASGAAALILNTTGERNTAVGTAAMVNNSTGNDNTAVGDHALFNNISGFGNTAVGFQALFNNTTNDNNTATGKFALSSNTIGSGNTANGNSALGQNISGSNNTALGRLALATSTGSGNIAVGFQAGALVGSSGNVIAIGSPGDDVDNTCFIGNIRDVQTQNADAIAVLVDSAGQLGTASSSRRFKNEIKSMDQTSQAILALKPVTFHYKSDKRGTPQFGLIAEEVAEVNPDLVVRDKNGEIYTVRYDAVNAMLLNEFLKEHRRVEELQSAMAQQRKDFETAIIQQRKATEALVARVNEQEAQIQKVGAQIEIAKSGPQMLVENQ
jgi:hypothetical protein